MRSFAIFLLPLLGLCVFGSTSVYAATVRAYVQPATARPNQMVTYVIVVQDGQLNRVPDLRFPLQISQASAASTSQQFQIINGKQSTSVQVSWGIVASEPGELVIPQQDILVDGQLMKTNEVKLTVGQGGPGPATPGQPGATAAAQDGNEPILQIELGKKEVYQGEVVPVSCSLYVSRRTPLRRTGLIDIQKSDFAIARFPQQSEQTVTVIDGIGYQVMTFRSTLSSLRTGDLKVGPATMEILVEAPIEGVQRPRLPPGFPQGFFGVPSEPRKVEVKSQQVTLKVLPLPEEGKPANFSGAVGDFRMTATATPTDGAVGDPIAVEIFVEGTGNFDALTTPTLTAPQGWKLYPAKRYNIEGQLDQNEVPTLERKIGYALVLVPESLQQTLPPFEFSFFSPTKKRYETLRTEPIALAMKPAPVPAASELSAGVSGQAAPGPPPVAPPQPDITDIVIRPSPQAQWLGTPSGGLLIRKPAFWAVQSVPVCLLALAGVFAFVRRRREAERAGLAGELKLAWAALEDPEASDPEFLRRAAQLIQRTQGAARIEDEALKAILDRYQSTNFSTAVAPPLSTSERQGIVQTLEPLLRRSLARTAVIAIAGLVICTQSLSAQETTKLTAAQIKAASPDEVYQQAVAEVEKGDFTRAQYLAESLTKRKPPQLSPEVFEIIGHSRYRQEDMGRAVLWYQRAQLFNPRSPELRQNLLHLTERLRFLTFSEDSPVKEWSYWLSPNEWVLLAAAGFWLVLLSIAWRVFSGKRHAALAVAISMIGFTIAVPASALAALRPPGVERVRDIYVVTSVDVRAFTAATVTSGTIMDLPPGSQVRLLERRGAWSYVEIPNQPESLRGWVEMAAMTPLWIWDTALVP